MRRLFGRLLADRRVVGGFFLVVQLVAVMYGLGWISDYWSWLPYFLNVLSFTIVIWLVRKYDNPTYKIAWIIIILVLPLFGGLFYLLWGNTPFNRARTQHKYEPITCVPRLRRNWRSSIRATLRAPDISMPSMACRRGPIRRPGISAWAKRCLPLCAKNCGKRRNLSFLNISSLKKV